MLSQLSSHIIFVLLFISGYCNAADSFSTVGSKVMKNGEWVVFNGFSFTCTEYMMRTNMGPLWAYEKCFGGVSQVNPDTIELNAEPGNVANILTNGFQTKPTIKKIQFNTPYDEIIDTDTPQKHPLVRIPTTASTYLYDADCVTGKASDYVNSLDLIITNLTNSGIAVAFDLHWSCPTPTAINCTQTGQSMMALREYNGPGSMGTVEFWDAVSKKYADNPYVFYELYNEPYFKDGDANFEIYYNGSDTYVGMLELYQAIRKNDPTGIIILAGAQSYAYDAATQYAFWLRYYSDFGEYPTNVMFNYHPYQGGSQGNEKAVSSALRMASAGRLLAPVIFTEFGQYCCSVNAEQCSNGQNGKCTGSHATADHFSYNIVNMALQYDISWTAWAWWGVDAYSAMACRSGGGTCNVLRNDDGSGLSNGTYGGAPWDLMWQKFVNNTDIMVEDTQKDPKSINVQSNVEEQAGYLPRPCIMGDYNQGNHCGYALDTNITATLNYSDFVSQSPYSVILPGYPPYNNCSLQGCPGFPCGATSICKT